MKLRQRIKAVQTYLRQRGEALRFDDIRDPRKARGQRRSMRDALIWPTEGTPDLPEACAATP